MLGTANFGTRLFWAHVSDGVTALEEFAGAGFQPENTPQRTEILAVAKEAGSTPGEIAIAWVAAKGVFPIIGPRTLAQLENNLGAARVRLSPDHLRRLDAVSAIPATFPGTVLDDPRIQGLVTGGMHARIDAPPGPVA